jgi:hypothetical protein
LKLCKAVELRSGQCMLDAAGQAGLAHDLTELLQRFNQGGSETLAVSSEYLEMAARKH